MDLNSDLKQKPLLFQTPVVRTAEELSCNQKLFLSFSTTILELIFSFSISSNSTKAFNPEQETCKVCITILKTISLNATECNVFR